MPRVCPRPPLTLFLTLVAMLAAGPLALAQGPKWGAGIDPVVLPPHLDVGLAPAPGPHLALLRLPPLAPVPAPNAVGTETLK
ncbi:MAG TPA: hypothetical protein VK911_12225, partial [Vicinamibacterales bacterium]|nr:hypothetical protein [Vicinamibacterales bacterium]